jgi:hypothetical protein
VLVRGDDKSDITRRRSDHSRHFQEPGCVPDCLAGAPIFTEDVLDLETDFCLGLRRPQIENRQTINLDEMTRSGVLRFDQCRQSGAERLRVEVAPYSELLTVAVANGDEDLGDPGGIVRCAFKEQGSDGGS